MMSLEFILMSTALIIIAVLAVYAGYLLIKVKKHRSELEEQAMKARLQEETKLKERREALINDLRFLANSVLQEQCEITEGVLRIQYVLEHLDPELWMSDEVESIRKHYELTSNMPILDAYKNLSKKEQMQLDKKRWTLEADAKLLIESEFRKLLNHQF